MLWTAFDLSYQINNIYNLSSRFSVDKNQIKSDYFVWFSLGFVFRFGLGFVFGFGIRITYGHIPLGHGHITKNIKPLFSKPFKGIVELKRNVLFFKHKLKKAYNGVPKYMDQMKLFITNERDFFYGSVP